MKDREEKESAKKMKEIIKELNKASLSNATGISYNRLRKFASGSIKKLSAEEKEKIYNYLLCLADKFKN